MGSWGQDTLIAQGKLLVKQQQQNGLQASNKGKNSGEEESGEPVRVLMLLRRSVGISVSAMGQTLSLVTQTFVLQERLKAISHS